MLELENDGQRVLALALLLEIAAGHVFERITVEKEAVAAGERLGLGRHAFDAFAHGVVKAGQLGLPLGVVAPGAGGFARELRLQCFNQRFAVGRRLGLGELERFGSAGRSGRRRLAAGADQQHIVRWLTLRLTAQHNRRLVEGTPAELLLDVGLGLRVGPSVAGGNQIGIERRIPVRR